MINRRRKKRVGAFDNTIIRFDSFRKDLFSTFINNLVVSSSIFSCEFCAERTLRKEGTLPPTKDCLPTQQG
jgi:hypothetical protein